LVLRVSGSKRGVAHRVSCLAVERTILQNAIQDHFGMVHSLPAFPKNKKALFTKMELTLRINEIAFGGSGVGKADGKVIFVPYTIDGELAQVRITESHKSFSSASVQTILQPSPYREEPPCPYYQTCGGCDYQHMQYPHQLEMKRLQVEQALRRIGKLPEIVVPPVIPSPKSYGFRNRITVHSDGHAIGFFRKRSRRIVDIVRCALASDTVNAKLTELRQRGLAAGSHATLREDDAITTFTQTNDEVARKILDYVRARVNGSVLVDAYCGSGFFAHQLASAFETVIGIERNQTAYDLAVRSALAHEKYHCGDVADLLPLVLQRSRVSTLLLDPPAEGLTKPVCATIGEYPPRTLIYISCNPATFARDLGRLGPRFRLIEVQPFDMFPQTAEIELAALLETK
jgi:tRNA/tmRNA/rRNA uracil-C5-methylase (TrmA/RlmC/RlmD family)